MSQPPRDQQSTADNEAILISLDQLSQTLEVMAKLVSRLKYQLDQPGPAGQRRSDDRTTSGTFH